MGVVLMLVVSLTGCLATTKTGQKWGDIGLFGGAATGAILSPGDPFNSSSTLDFRKSLILA
jgi:hypothetical protein